MSFIEFQPYILPLLVVAFFSWRFWSARRVRAQLPALLAQGAVVVDVRSPAEYASGSRPDSLNIPLGELGQKWSQLDRARPVILCCASGTRSGMAAVILKKNGFTHVVNAGAWKNTL